MKVLAVALALCFAGSAGAAAKPSRSSAVKHSKLNKSRAKVRKGLKPSQIKRLNANRAKAK